MADALTLKLDAFGLNVETNRQLKMSGLKHKYGRHQQDITDELNAASLRYAAPDPTSPTLGPTRQS